jgi:outer membrane protein assembly factor BamD (BamD/ComL family)
MDNDQYKQALTLCDKYLKKHPATPIMQVIIYVCGVYAHIVGQGTRIE